MVLKGSKVQLQFTHNFLYCRVIIDVLYEWMFRTGIYELI